MILFKKSFGYSNFQTQKSSKMNTMYPRLYDSVTKTCYSHYTVNSIKTGTISAFIYHWIPGTKHNAWNIVSTPKKIVE